MERKVFTSFLEKMQSCNMLLVMLPSIMVPPKILPLPVPKHLAAPWMKEIATASMQAVQTPARKTSVPVQEPDVEVVEVVGADVGAMVASVAAMVPQKVLYLSLVLLLCNGVTRVYTWCVPHMDTLCVRYISDVRTLEGVCVAKSHKL
ncbi:hypothetical protein DVH05_024877 [Phytophthora capsici]|nr:hypothetical protein DVH05_024877 [Phytophthora capsici]